jgi:hypothetical protein
MGEYYAYSSDFNDFSDDECLIGSPVTLSQPSAGYKPLQEAKSLITNLQQSVKTLKKENSDLKEKYNLLLKLLNIQKDTHHLIKNLLLSERADKVHEEMPGKKRVKMDL